MKSLTIRIKTGCISKYEYELMMLDSFIITPTYPLSVCSSQKSLHDFLIFYFENITSWCKRQGQVFHNYSYRNKIIL